jgi:hypothetical protein
MTADLFFSLELQMVDLVKTGRAREVIVGVVVPTVGCSGQSFLPIRKVNSGMRVIRGGRLKDGHSNIHLYYYSEEDAKGGSGIP